MKSNNSTLSIDRRSLGQQITTLVTPTRLLIVIVLLGALLRFYRYNALSLWLDEGFTVYFSRLPWHTVLGLDGAYDVHPPLYYALVKGASSIVPDVVAGRLLSVVAGTITIPVFYALVTRLAGAWVAVFSSLVLAISPLHIWYSQEARQYALVVLVVCISYLALIAFSQSLHPGWAVLYSASLIVALYIDYSSIYALVPEALVVAVIIRQQRRRALLLVVAAGVAALAFLPWLPQLLSVAGNVSNSDQFVVRPVRVASSLLSISGLAEPLQGQSEPGGVISGASTQVPTLALAILYGVLVLGALPAIVIGFLTLIRRSRLAMLVMLCLLVGTIATAIIISLVYPGYVKRTVLSAVLGWALLLGAAPVATGLSAPLRIIARASFAFCLAVSLIVIGTTYASADKQHWRELAADSATATQNASLPKSSVLLITYPTITETLLDVYQPHLADVPHLRVDDGGSVPASITGDAVPHSILLAYIDVPGIEKLQNQLQALGYTRVSQKAYPGTLYLDSFLHP